MIDPNERTMPDTPPEGYGHAAPPPPGYQPPPYYQQPPPPKRRSPLTIFLIALMVILCCLTVIVGGAAGYMALGNQPPGGGLPVAAQPTEALVPIDEQAGAQPADAGAQTGPVEEEEPTAQPSNTPRPTATSRPTNTPAAECGTRASRLEEGGEAKVVVYQVSLREQPGTDQPRLNVAAEGRILFILEGPICEDDGYWWYVQTELGEFGWVLEGDAENYYLEPQ
jgi:hypothetical protein